MSLTEGKLPQNSSKHSPAKPAAKRVLIVTYYWPPSGGGGVQRWLKFAKLLPGLGWEPVIVTPSNPDVPVQDVSLLEDVAEGLEIWSYPVWEPTRLLSAVGIGGSSTSRLGADQAKSYSMKNRMLNWVRGNFFVPDARVGWVDPTSRKVLKKLRTNPVDLIVTTGPPHSMHLIGLALKQATGLPWVADFRDPWSTMDYLEEFNLSEKAKKRMKTLERKVVDAADRLVVTSPGALSELGVPNSPKGAVLPNGWDRDDFPSPVPPPYPQNNPPVIGHFGALYGSRNPRNLWPALARIGWSLRIGGQVTPEVKKDILRSGVRVEWLGDLGHKEAVLAMHECHALLVTHNDSASARSSTPGKLFECLATGRPLLVIGPKDGDLEARCHALGLSYLPHQTPEKDISSWLQQLDSDSPANTVSKELAAIFERRVIATELADMFNALLPNS